MPGPDRSSPTGPRVVQPPRPANAWILYRSDKVRELPPPAPGLPRRAQAEVSKLISNMWKNETEETRSEYERRADAKKAEHQAMYPGYRFQPKKKEEKERLREEKKLEKERGREQSKKGRARPAPYTTGHVGPSVPYNGQYYQPDVLYGPAGPSPPMSAASSPNEGPYELQNGFDDQLQSLPNYASPSPNSHTNVSPSSNPLSSFSSQLHPSPSQFAGLPIVAPQPSHPQLPLPGPSQWQQPSQQGASHASTPVPPIWQGFNMLPALDSVSQDFMNFNLPAPNLQGWMPSDSNSDSFTDTMQAMLSATGDPSIFQLSNFNIEDLLSNPQGEIEVSMGQIPFAGDQNFSSGTEIFGDYDFASAASGPSSQYESTNASLSQTFSPTEPATDLSMFFSNQVAQNTSTVQRDFSFNPDNIFDFLNFEGSVPADTQRAPSGPIHSHPMPQSNVAPTHTVSSTPYAPPAGAAYSSTRRVGASWKPTFAMPPDSPTDRSPLRGPRGMSAS